MMRRWGYIDDAQSVDCDYNKHYHIQIYCTHMAYFENHYFVTRGGADKWNVGLRPMDKMMYFLLGLHLNSALY